MKLIKTIIILALMLMNLPSLCSKEAGSFIASSFAVSADDANSLNIATKKGKMSKSPMGAVYRSLVFPGWGQYYVESYWKIPLFTGGMIASAYIAVNNHIKYSDKVKEIDNFLAISPENENSSRHDLFKRQREVYRDNRDQALFVLAGVYIVSAIDAYVGAHLFDFDVSDDVSMQLRPHIGNTIGLGVSLKIK